MGNIKPIHHEPKRVQQLSSELLYSGAIGAAKGLLIGLTSGLFLTIFNKTCRTVRTPVKAYYLVAWASMGCVFGADKQLINFSERMYSEESIRRQNILDEAADRGIFLEDDRRNLDNGLATNDD